MTTKYPKSMEALNQVSGTGWQLLDCIYEEIERSPKSDQPMKNEWKTFSLEALELTGRDVSAKEVKTIWDDAMWVKTATPAQQVAFRSQPRTTVRELRYRYGNQKSKASERAGQKRLRINDIRVKLPKPEDLDKEYAKAFHIIAPLFDRWISGDWEPKFETLGYLSLTPGMGRQADDKLNATGTDIPNTIESITNA